MDDFKLDPCSDVDLWIDSDEETQERRETDSIQLEDVNSDFDLDDDIEPRYIWLFGNHDVDVHNYTESWPPSTSRISCCLFLLN